MVEIGVGYSADASILERSPALQERIAKGGLYLAVDRDEYNLRHIKEGAVARMRIDDFAESNYLDGKVRTMYIFNVFGDPTSGISEKYKKHRKQAEHLLPLLARKLAPGGSIIIGENYTPCYSDFLKDLPYAQHDLKVEVHAGDAYRERVKELGINISYYPDPRDGVPFILEIRKQD